MSIAQAFSRAHETRGRTTGEQTHPIYNAVDRFHLFAPGLVFSAVPTTGLTGLSVPSPTDHPFILFDGPARPPRCPVCNRPQHVACGSADLPRKPGVNRMWHGQRGDHRMTTNAQPHRRLVFFSLGKSHTSRNSPRQSPTWLQRTEVSSALGEVVATS